MPMFRTLALSCALLAAAACSRLAVGPGESAVSLSLIGAFPELDEVDVTVSAPDMRTITRRLDFATPRLVIEVPPGRERTFRVAAVSDVYSGSVTRALRGEEHATIEVPLLGGPLIASPGSPEGTGFTGLLQIRDLRVDASGLPGEIPPTAREITGNGDGLRPAAAVYDNLGRIWSLDHDGEEAQPLLINRSGVVFGGDQEGPLFEELVQLPALLASSPVSNILYLGYTAENGTGGAWEIAAFDYEGNPLSRFVPQERSGRISGMTVDNTGTLHILYLYEGEPKLVRLSGSTGSTVGRALALTGANGVPSYNDPATPFGDVLAIGDYLYVVSSQGFGRSPVRALRRFTLDHVAAGTYGVLNPETPARAGTFVGPRRFVSNRSGELIVIDVQDILPDDDPPSDGPLRRVIGFEYGSTENWSVFDPDGELEYFDIDPDFEADAPV